MLIADERDAKDSRAGSKTEERRHKKQEEKMKRHEGCEKRTQVTRYETGAALHLCHLIATP
jgi:hypothetical protein